MELNITIESNTKTIISNAHRRKSIKVKKKCAKWKQQNKQIYVNGNVNKSHSPVSVWLHYGTPHTIIDAHKMWYLCENVLHQGYLWQLVSL